MCSILETPPTRRSKRNRTSLDRGNRLIDRHLSEPVYQGGCWTASTLPPLAPCVLSLTLGLSVTLPVTSHHASPTAMTSHEDVSPGSPFADEEKQCWTFPEEDIVQFCQRSVEYPVPLSQC